MRRRQPQPVPSPFSCAHLLLLPRLVAVLNFALPLCTLLLALPATTVVIVNAFSIIPPQSSSWPVVHPSCRGGRDDIVKSSSFTRTSSRTTSTSCRRLQSKLLPQFYPCPSFTKRRRYESLQGSQETELESIFPRTRTITSPFTTSPPSPWVASSCFGGSLLPRRTWLSTATSAWVLFGSTAASNAATAATGSSSSIMASSTSFSSDESLTPTTTATTTTTTTSISEPRITDRIFLTIKGLPASSPAPTESNDDTNYNSNARRIVIGLYGDYASQSVAKLKALVSRSGLPAPCKPRAERALQKEQLEANKVYNSCLEGETVGVTWQYSTVWRILRNVRIDLGAVTGKFVARESPNWIEATNNPNTTTDTTTVDANRQLFRTLPAGVVSVRRGSDSGFGITISPKCFADDKDDNKKDSEYVFWTQDLQDNHIVVGRVLEGMDVVQVLNQDVPVITTAKQFNYMALTGNNSNNNAKNNNNAPNRSCQYGGPMYCNENKPLIKLTIVNVGLL
ncbi:hypothetical protein ACA910_011520 [Epithemia clementina (nom. ined.)]